jgi:large subunit ribosomal protein L18
MSRIKDLSNKRTLRIKRKRRIRGSIFGTAELPRLSITKSNKYLLAQAINDVDGVTLASINSKDMKLRVNKTNAIVIGKAMAENLAKNNVSEVVFDRNGYLYHGVVAEFANSLRNNGIKV